MKEELEISAPKRVRRDEPVAAEDRDYQPPLIDSTKVDQHKHNRRPRCKVHPDRY